MREERRLPEPVRTRSFTTKCTVFKFNRGIYLRQQQTYWKCARANLITPRSVSKVNIHAMQINKNTRSHHPYSYRRIIVDDFSKLFIKSPQRTHAYYKTKTLLTHYYPYIGKKKHPDWWIQSKNQLRLHWPRQTFNWYETCVKMSPPPPISTVVANFKRLDVIRKSSFSVYDVAGKISRKQFHVYKSDVRRWHKPWLVCLVFRMI